MSPETLTALQQSIAKWERNARVRKPENAHVLSDSCPLCEIYINYACAGCPVDDASGANCLKTPWLQASDAKDEWDISHSLADGRSFRAAARAEVEFLKSLLPESQS